MVEAKQANQISHDECDREEIALREYCESRFPVGESTTTYLSVTGEEYIQLTPAMNSYPTSPLDARNAAQSAFDTYAADKSGTLYWRIRPEIAGRLLHKPERVIYIYYMRLLISDKPRIS
jgi:hypothetical protein